MSVILRLHNAVANVCPEIDGVSLGASGPAIQFRQSATPEQRAAAQAVVDAFDFDAEESRQEKIKQIEALENEITPRRRDEAILGVDNGWLAAKRQEINTLRNNT